MLHGANCQWELKTFHRGEIINTDADILYLIKQGSVKISTYDLSGKIIILGYWGKGDVLGESLTKIDPYEIKCITTVEINCIPYQDWHHLAKEIRSCYQDIEKILYILGQNNVEGKLLELLIFLSDKFGSMQANGKAILLPLSHRELAEFLGTTRVSITRAMNRLQSKKIVESPKRGFLILHTSKISRLNYKI